MFQKTSNSRTVINRSRIHDTHLSSKESDMTTLINDRTRNDDNTTEVSQNKCAKERRHHRTKE